VGAGTTLAGIMARETSASTETRTHLLYTELLIACTIINKHDTLTRMVDVFPLREKCCHLHGRRCQARNAVAGELRDGEGDDRVWEKLCEHYNHVPAMNRRAPQGSMYPVLSEERMVR
jgi:hypothetical protein